MMHYRAFRRWSIALITGLLVVLLSVGLAACGYNGAVQSQGGTPAVQHPAPTQPTQTTRRAPTSTARPSSQVQRCGVVYGYGTLEVVPQGGDLAVRVENCFWQAFQHCRPATLIFTTGGIAKRDPALVLTHTFIIHAANGSCSLSDVVQHGAFPNRTQPANAAYLCSGLKRLPEALEMLSCGQEGTISVQGL